MTTDKPVADDALPEPVAWVKDTSLLALRRDESTVLAYPHDYLIRPAVAIYTADQLRAAIARERAKCNKCNKSSL